jgi:hypothetical protein
MPKAKTKKNPSKAKSPSKAKKDTGAKLPKALRKLNPLKDLMNSNLGREILADALIAAAGAAAAALTRTRTAKKAGAAALDAGSQTADRSKDAMQTAAGAVAGVVTEAARHFLPASLTGEPEEETKANGSKASSKAPRAANLSSDHSKRKTSPNLAKDVKP